jgi:DNA-binding transcriptional LysR family regulator
MAAYATEMVGLADQARREAARPTLLRLAAVTTAGEYVVPPLLKEFQHAHPDVAVSLEVGNRAAVLGAVERREVDLGIGGSPPDDHAITGTPFRAYRLLVVAAPGPRRRDLADQVWLLRERGSGTRATVERYLAEAGIAPRATMTLGSNGAVRQGAVVGLGVTLLSDHAVAAQIEGGALVALRAPGTPLRRSWYLLHPRRGPRTAAAEMFGEFCLATAETT